ncbi:ethylbenzene dehydrogenase-related protein [Natranaerofaba carboxydovora]|uniref:ethylbenzene dehydrogenase-related protein n=1 Tax=Natranaerofaba carboxydovora TaxID=2742683 RepID=UPI001F137D77|nr:ethylbenzene dehydrogenase-related protein [Natranaerofaba carboxydovora]
MKKIIVLVFLMLAALLPACELIDIGPDSPEEEDKEKADEKSLKEPIEVEVRAAHTDDEIAFHFEWESRKGYPAQFSDIMKYDGQEWTKLEGEDEVVEDRVSIMFEDPENEIEGFGEAGCYVSCHKDMEHHYVEVEDEEEVGEFSLDMWDFGGQIGSMDYARDKWIMYEESDEGVSGVERDIIDDEEKEELPEWVSEEGASIIKDQPMSAGEWEGKIIPRFVFDPDEVIFENFFYSDEEGNLITDPDELKESIDDMEYETLNVAYQDFEFDPEQDRVNSIDVKFLVLMANDELSPDIGEEWEEYWSKRLNITTPEGAKELLNEIVEELEEGALISSNTGYVFESSQHDVRTTREFDVDTNTWSVTLIRDIEADEDEEDPPVEEIEEEEAKEEEEEDQEEKEAEEKEAEDDENEDENDEENNEENNDEGEDEEEPVDDVDFEALLEEEIYNMAFSIHDIEKDGIFHHVSLPFEIGGEEVEADLEIANVEEDLTIDTTDEVDRVNWDDIEPLEVTVYLPGEVYYDDLTDEEFHGEGANFIEDETSCKDCHTEEEIYEKSKEYID